MPEKPTRRGFARLHQPIDARGLAAFRIAFGVLMFWEAARYLAAGWIDSHYVDPAVHFTYFGLEWVRPLSRDAMYGVFLLLGASSVGIALGAWYRASAVTFFVTFTYVFLLEQARYLNHFYLIILLGFLLIFLPAHRVYSLDAARRPSLRSATVPAWTLWLLRFQIGLVYCYAGVAKMNGDWMSGEPLTAWLAARADTNVLAPLLQLPEIGLIFSWVALLLDFFAAPLLLWRRTRVLTFCLLLTFHGMNKLLFSIGVFPVMMVAATTVFLEPDWPRRLGPFMRDVPGVRLVTTPSRGGRRVLVAALAAWCVFQIAVPLRHFVYPGNVSWNELGHRFAWHMKLRDKEATAVFVVYDPDTGWMRRVDPADELVSWQTRKMPAQPDMILQYAHHLARRARADGHDRVEVRVLSRCSLNGRPMVPLVDPDVDLAAERRTLGVPSWVLPLHLPLKPE